MGGMKMMMKSMSSLF